MDLETEQHLAALIMDEASRLRIQADREGVHVYLNKKKSRGRPNSQFLQATVRGIQQANRAAEVNEMWRRREKEIELEHVCERHNRTAILVERGGIRKESRATGPFHHDSRQKRLFSGLAADGDSDSHYYRRHKSFAMKMDVDNAEHSSSENELGCTYDIQDDIRDEGLKDDEVEHFLLSRAKRGRGSIGCRMDEPGPYPFSEHGDSFHDVPSIVGRKVQIVGPTVGPSHVSFKKGDLKGKKKRRKRKKKKEEEEERRKHKVVDIVERGFNAVRSKGRHDKMEEKEEKRKKKPEREDKVSKKRRKHHASSKNSF